MADTVPVARKSCLRRGCFGCAVVFGAGLGLLLVVAMISLIRGTPEVVRKDTSSAHEVPASGSALLIDPGQLGRVVLDISMANFRIVPEPAGTPVRLDAFYNSGSYELEESMVSDGELGWTYRLSFGRRSAFDFFHIDPDNRLELHLPAGTQLLLEGSVGVGGSRMELGGLWIESVDLEIGVGNHRIGFDQPLQVPMTRFALNGSIGETRVSMLGNASPAEVLIQHRIGDFSVDLDGAWLNDSMVVLRSSIGGFRIGLPPQEIGFELLGASIGIGESNTRRARDRPEPPPGAPVVRLKANQSLGELRLTR